MNQCYAIDLYWSQQNIAFWTITVIHEKHVHNLNDVSKSPKDFIKARRILKGIESVSYSSGPGFMIAAGKIRNMHIVRKDLLFLCGANRDSTWSC
jgi:hypothetical protein